MATCADCGATVLVLSSRDILVDGRCQKCHQAFLAGGPNPARADQAHHARVASIILTTETAHNLPVVDRLDIVTAECVIGMHLFKDVASAFRDVFGGRSKAMQDGLREARKTALLELRKEAAAVGADAVVGVDLDYSEISGGGKSMLFLVASGTAVKLQS